VFPNGAEGSARPDRVPRPHIGSEIGADQQSADTTSPAGRADR
jgi:hypothetical protein